MRIFKVSICFLIFCCIFCLESIFNFVVGLLLSCNIDDNVKVILSFLRFDILLVFKKFFNLIFVFNVGLSVVVFDFLFIICCLNLNLYRFGLLVSVSLIVFLRVSVFCMGVWIFLFINLLVFVVWVVGGLSNKFSM